MSKKKAKKVVEKFQAMKTVERAAKPKKVEVPQKTKKETEKPKEKVVSKKKEKKEVLLREEIIVVIERTANGAKVKSGRKDAVEQMKVALKGNYVARQSINQHSTVATWRAIDVK